MKTLEDIAREDIARELGFKLNFGKLTVLSNVPVKGIEYLKEFGVVGLGLGTNASLVLHELPETGLNQPAQTRMGIEIARRAVAGEGRHLLITHSNLVLMGVEIYINESDAYPQNSDAIEDVVAYHMSDKATGWDCDVIQMNGHGRWQHHPDGFFDEWGKSLSRL